MRNHSHGRSMLVHTEPLTPRGQVINAIRNTVSTTEFAVRTNRLAMDATTARTRLPNMEISMIRNQLSWAYARWSSATGTVWAPNASPKKATERDATISINARLIGLRAGRCWRGAGSSGPLADIYAVRVETRENAVLDRAAQQVDLGRSGTAHFDVLGADAVKVLARRRIPDAELLCGKLERQSGRVQVKDLALSTTQLGFRKVAVGVDRRRPLQVVQHVTTSDRRYGAHHDLGCGRLGDHPGGAGGEGLAHQGDTVGDAVHQHGRPGGLDALHVLGDRGAITE